MLPKAVFFDMDGTLVHLPPDFTPACFLLSVYRKLGLKVELEEVGQTYEEVEGWWEEHFQDYTLWTRENFVEFNRRVLLQLGCAAKVKELMTLAEKMQDHWERLPDEAGEELYADVPPALALFRNRGLILGIVSHRALSAIQCSLKRHGLVPFFQILVTPQVAGAPRGKHNPAMWEYALNQIGVRPHEAVHVGDSYLDDVVSARASGLLPILLNRTGSHEHPHCLRAKDLLEVGLLLGL